MGKDEQAARISRVDGRAKVTGSAAYAADHQPGKFVYGFLVGSTIAKGRIKSLDTRSAEQVPGVLAVITHLNAPKLPGYSTGKDPAKPQTQGKPMRFFSSDKIAYYDQAIALVIAATLEQAMYAARLVKATYKAEAPATELAAHLDKAKVPNGSRFEDYNRGEADAYRQAAVKIEQEYDHPVEVHNPMEPAGIMAIWEDSDRVTVYTKTQGVQATQKSVQDAFGLPLENITVHAPYVGGAFGMGLRTWPYEIAAIMGAQLVGRPLKLVLHREQMFTNVGYRPATRQLIGLGATAEGRLTGITHNATGNTSSYEEFTEATVNISRFMYACPNVTTRYRIVPLDVATPIWMRGPGEATGSFALESAMDEMAFALNMDPLAFRVLNHADTDPEKNLPWSSKHLKECYELGAARIGWQDRKLQPGTNKDGDWLIGYGMGAGAFGASRGTAHIKASLQPDGRLTLQCSVNDMGPGTATMMAAIAAKELGLSPDRIKIQMGSTGFPPGPTQGGSTVTSTVGSGVHMACRALKKEIADLAGKAGSALHQPDGELTAEALDFTAEGITLKGRPSVKMTYADLLRQHKLPAMEVTKVSKGREHPYSSYGFSVHFVKLRVHPATGRVRVDHVVSCADAGYIVSPKTAESQMIGGAVGGIGMALMEELMIDHRYGRPINNNLADYHVPVHADIPKVDVLFVHKKDPVINPIGAKGLGEIALVGVAPAIANAVFNAIGKRIRSLPITPDKILGA